MVLGLPFIIGTISLIFSNYIYPNHSQLVLQVEAIISIPIAILAFYYLYRIGKSEDKNVEQSRNK